MPTSVWKGHLTFGLASIPVKLYRAARADKVEFRQIHEPTGDRVRQALLRESQHSVTTYASNRCLETDVPDSCSGKTRAADGTIPFPAPGEISRSELAKGYEYEPGRYLVLRRDEINGITPRTAHEMQITGFVQLAEVEPVYFETSYYVAPDRAGERAYGLLFAALRQSGLVGIAQVAMHRREHVVVIRPGRTGIVLHTMFYETEIRREDEFRTDTSKVLQKELDLALMVIGQLAGPFDPSKYRDSYREKLDELIAAKLKVTGLTKEEHHTSARVYDIVEALQRTLEITARKSPAATEAPNNRNKKKRSSRTEL